MAFGEARLNRSARRRHWARTRSLAGAALLVWLVLALVVPWVAPQLDALDFLGFPLGFYMIAQGSMILFVATLFWHDWAQDRVDEEFGLDED